VISYGSDGLSNDWKPEIERHAKALAAAGILALIPDYFKKRPEVPHGASGIVFPSIIGRHSDWEKVIRDAVGAAALPSVGATRVGLLGFSLGGFLNLRVRDSVKVMVAFFAPYKFPTIDIPMMKPLLEGLGPNQNAALKAQIHHGDADTLVPLTQHADPIELALRAEGAEVTLIPHPGANHGFSGNDAANKTARDQSLDASLAFFAANL
jgi:dienelactone hydrolase